MSSVRAWDIQISKETQNVVGVHTCAFIQGSMSMPTNSGVQKMNTCIKLVLCFCRNQNVFLCKTKMFRIESKFYSKH